MLARDLYVWWPWWRGRPRTAPTPGATLVTAEMVAALETGFDDLLARCDMPSDFTVPGENLIADVQVSSRPALAAEHGAQLLEQVPQDAVLDAEVRHRLLGLLPENGDLGLGAGHRPIRFGDANEDAGQLLLHCVEPPVRRSGNQPPHGVDKRGSNGAAVVRHGGDQVRAAGQHPPRSGRGTT